MSKEVWDTVQARFARNRVELSGNPRRVYTRIECGKSETGEETRVFVPKEIT